MAYITRFLTFFVLGTLLAWSTLGYQTNRELQQFREVIKTEREADPGLGVSSSHSVSLLVRKDLGTTENPGQLSDYDWRTRIEPWSPASTTITVLIAGAVAGLLGFAFPLLLGHWLVLLLSAAVITTGIYSAANVGLVRDAMPTRSAAETARTYSLRDAFLTEIGRDSIPSSADDLPQWFRRAAKHFRNANTAAKELADETRPAGGDWTNEQKARAMLAVLNTPDQVHVHNLKSRFGLEVLTLPNPANSHFGYNAPGTTYLQGSLRQRAGGTPDVGQVLDVLATAAATGTSGEFSDRGLEALAELVTKDVERLHDNLTATVLRRANGPVQWFTMLLAIYGLLVIMVRWQRQTRDVAAKVNSVVKARPEWDALGYLRGKGGPVDFFAARACWHDLDQNDKAKATPAGHILSQTASAWLSVRDREQARSAANAAKESWFDRYANQREGLNYITWAIPSAGFVGTVLGIGNAMAQADGILAPGQDQGQQLKLVFQELAVAFDTTLVALLASLVLMLLLHLLRQSEGRVLLSVFDSVQEHFVNRLTPARPRLELSIQGNRRVECELRETNDLQAPKDLGGATVEVTVLRDRVGEQLETPRNEAYLLSSLDADSYRRVVATLLDIDPNDLAAVPRLRRKLYEAWLALRESNGEAF